MIYENLKENVLDKGFIEVVSVSTPMMVWEAPEGLMYSNTGDPETIPANTARVSYGKQQTKIDDSAIKLMKFLTEHKHTSPFRHIYVGLRVKAPEFVGRQWWKHVVGSEYTFQDNPWNEISGRYVEIQNEFYIPKQFGKQPDKKHQGGIGYLEGDIALDCEETYKKFLDQVELTYKLFLNVGMSKEHARMVLPISFYTEYIWTASLQAIQHFIKLRDKPEAQAEIREYAKAMKLLMSRLLPNNTEIFLDGKAESKKEA